MKQTLVALVLSVVVVVLGYVFAVTRNLPDVDRVLEDGINPTHWTQIFAADGSPIMSFGKFHHKRVPIAEVSPHFVDALLATEDRRFRVHKGVDPVAIGRAVVSDISHGKIKEGGSTLTQQLARNVFLNNERSFSRKVREAVLAMKLESRLSKDEILELYVNNIYFGEGAYGIQAASEIYFDKRPSQLSVDEAALLAGLPQAPSGYNPFQNPDAAKARRDEVIDNLVEVGKLSVDEAESFKSKSFSLNRSGQQISSSDKAPYFNRYVMEQVQRYFNLDEQAFWQSGLKIYTTLDANGQRLAEQSLVSKSNGYGRTGKNQQAALVSINPQTGAILAYVGGKDYQQSQFDRVSSAIRSPGSLFKIFTYTTAIDRGYEPSRVYLDEPIAVAGWRPQNYDKGHHGYMTIARALITSNNIIAVKVLNELGPEAVIHTARQMGVKSRMEPYLGLTLGGSGVNLLEITSAFGVLANQGVRVEPYAIDRITDEAGKVIYEHHPVKMDVLNRTTVDTMVKMMMGVVDRGTGRSAAIGRPIAGKTGTSDDYKDAWFIGFTPEVVTGVWVGNDNNTPMRGMTGGSLPAAIWKGYMQPFVAARPARDFDLAYSKPLNETDFTSYNLDNLSDKDMTNDLATLEVKDGGELQQDPLLEPLKPEDAQDPSLPSAAHNNPPPVGPDGRIPIDPIHPVPQPSEPVRAPVPSLPENPAPQNRVNPPPQYTGPQTYGTPANRQGGRAPGYPIIPVERQPRGNAGRQLEARMGDPVSGSPP